MVPGGMGGGGEGGGARGVAKGGGAEGEATYLATLHRFRDAVLRWCYGIRKQYANRRYTNLTDQVSDTTRASYPTLVQLTPRGEHTLTNVFKNAIADAEKALEHHSQHR